MIWKIYYTDEAKDDLRSLDRSQRKNVLKAITKVSQNPLPANKGGYGNPLGNKHGHDLTVLYKIKLKRDGIRIVYALIRTETSMKIIVISARADDAVYGLASKRME